MTIITIRDADLADNIEATIIATGGQLRQVAPGTLTVVGDENRVLAKVQRMNVLTTTIDHEHQITRTVLTGRDILRLLAIAGYHAFKSTDRVYLHVPSGGDYANMELDIDREVPIIVSGKAYDAKKVASLRQGASTDTFAP